MKYKKKKQIERENVKYLRKNLENKGLDQTHTHTLNTYNNWRKQYQSGVVAAGWNWCYKI